jgi:hypothetical protein
MRLCSVSVDLDEVRHYFAIHGIGPPSPARAHVVYDAAVERLAAWAAEHRIPLTFFVVGAATTRPENAARLRALASRGHEIANHSLDHRYDLIRLGPEEMERQVVEGATLIEQTGVARPVGFRAPGYLVTDELLRIVRRSGATYDSSVFPCPGYDLVKLTAIAYGRLRRRRSSSIVGPAWAWLAPTRPYRMGNRWWRTGSGLLELPIQVAGPVRVPYIGTMLTLSGPRWARRLTSALERDQFINLELHGMDALDEADGLSALAPHQPDVRVAFARKLGTLSAVVHALEVQGRTFVTLREAAARMG